MASRDAGARLAPPLRVGPDLLAEARRNLADLVAIPSVSARAEGCDACAASVAALLAGAEFRTDVQPGDVAPTVVGETGQGAFTLVIYNHYDVQPEDPVVFDPGV